jgi:hypothetical protein
MEERIMSQSEGRAGIAPPPDAPIEISRPLTDAAVSEMAAKARTNERTLAPLVYGSTPAATDVSDVPVEVQEPAPVQAAPGFPANAKPNRYVDAKPSSEFPAASNSDGPLRGLPGTAPVPAAREKPQLRPMGGFGEAEAEYFPLNGAELKTLVEQLLDELYARIQNDMRFHIAVTYPRLSARLQLVVTGEADDQTMVVEKVMPDQHRTPLEVAQQHGDSVVFVVAQQRREFDEQGNVEQPADAMRDELGLRKPRKRQVKTGAGSSIVDVTW